MTDNKMPYNIDNNLQTRLAMQGKDVASFVSQMDTMSDQEIANELNVSLEEAKNMKRQYNEGTTAGTFIVD